MLLVAGADAVVHVRVDVEGGPCAGQRLLCFGKGCDPIPDSGDDGTRASGRRWTL